MSHQISVLLTSHKRTGTLARQIHAVCQQTVKPAELCIWHNDGGITPDYSQLGCHNTVFCNRNWGVWSRFFHCLNFRTPYIAVFDDDTIPGPKWLETAIALLNQPRVGLVGAAGVRFPGGTRAPREYTGWKAMNDHDEQADIVGHSWVFRPTLLVEFVKWAGQFERELTCGEDYLLSYAAQQRGQQTWVPAHPADDRSVWGSIDGMLGTDDAALYRQPGEEEKKAAFHALLKRNGWKTLSEKK